MKSFLQLQLMASLFSFSVICRPASCYRYCKNIPYPKSPFRMNACQEVVLLVDANLGVQARKDLSALFRS